MQGRKRSKGMSKSKTGNGHGTERVRQGQAYRVPRTESRVKVRMENREVMDTK